MALYVGNSGVTSLYYGTSASTKAYYGTTLVFGASRDYSQEYLTFEIVSAGTLIFGAVNSTIQKTIEYSTDGGSTWTSWTGDTGNTAINVSAGDNVLVKGMNSTYASSQDTYTFFGGTSVFKLSGNIMSLVYGDNFTGQTALNTNYTFNKLFSGSNAISTENLVMPATTLTNYCYNNIFSYCSGMTSTVKSLPATTMKMACYQSMYRACSGVTSVSFTLPTTNLAGGTICYSAMLKDTSITTPPVLPATILAQSCYQGMFEGTPITTAPELPATAVTDFCYNQMFKNCTSLTTAPELPAEQLRSYSYNEMFKGCTSLNYVKCLATTISASNAHTNWLDGVSATGTFVKPASMTSWPSGASGIPTGWTVVDAS